MTYPEGSPRKYEIFCANGGLAREVSQKFRLIQVLESHSILRPENMVNSQIYNAKIGPFSDSGVDVGRTKDLQ